MNPKAPWAGTSYQVPGFGCTYISEAEDDSSAAPFLLRFVHRGDTLSFTPKKPTALFLLEAGRAKLSSNPGAGAKNSTEAISFRDWIVLPPKQLIHLSAETLLVKVAALGFCHDDVSSCQASYGLLGKDLAALLQKKRTLSSTLWIQELFHRAIFERALAKQAHSFASRFCRQELIKEAFYQSFPAPKDHAALPAPRHHDLSPAMQRALLYLESHLHTPLGSTQLSRAAALSESALLRLFNRELGMTPMKYVWHRRLQDANLLLQTGRYRVSEVASLVGFADISSFSQAYTKLFGVPPSTSRRFD